MEHDGKVIAERAKYCQSMMNLLEQRANKYGTFIEEHGYTPMAGVSIDRHESRENLKRMIVQLRTELLELGRMI